MNKLRTLAMHPKGFSCCPDFGPRDLLLLLLLLVVKAVVLIFEYP